ncbi:MAG: hypothetical protein AB8B52_13680 [Winogradskyella sp.]|uniref:hypothetical protein n=1 Tax=Winogradskyella sp. TaxID=1883156 RepID=UPI00385FA424
MSTHKFSFKDDKLLKSITMLTALYAVMMFLKYFGNLSGLFWQSKNPLLPKYLPYYVAFPLYVLLPALSMIIFLCYRMLQQKRYNFKVVYGLFAIVFFFFLWEWRVLEFLMNNNPYA